MNQYQALLDESRRRDKERQEKSKRFYIIVGILAVLLIAVNILASWYVSNRVVRDVNITYGLNSDALSGQVTPLKYLSGAEVEYKGQYNSTKILDLTLSQNGKFNSDQLRAGDYEIKAVYIIPDFLVFHRDFIKLDGPKFNIPMRVLKPAPIWKYPGINGETEFMYPARPLYQDEILEAKPTGGTYFLRLADIVDGWIEAYPYTNIPSYTLDKFVQSK